MSKKRLILVELNEFNEELLRKASENLNLNNWRKPNPNMIFEASKDFPINLKKSIIIGDRLSDIQAGARAGISSAFHVLTGHGRKERICVEKRINSEGFFEDHRKKISIKLINSLRNIPKENL